MKKINFLIKLYIENKIQEVEPSEEIKNAYMERSRESLSSAKILLDVNNLKDSVALKTTINLFLKNGKSNN